MSLIELVTNVHEKWNVDLGLKAAQGERVQKVEDLVKILGISN